MAPARPVASSGCCLPRSPPTRRAPARAGYLKEDRTVNNAVGKELTTEKTAPGGVDRLSVAVILDANTLGSTDTTTVQQLVASAAGVDAARGDIVQVDKLPFDTTATQEAKQQLEQAEAAAKTAGYIDMGQKAGLVLLVVIVAVVMMIRRKKSAPASVDVSASDLPEGVLMPARMEALAAERMRELNAARTGDSTGASSPALERDRLRNEVSAFVDSEPDEIAALVQGWLTQRSD